MSASARISKNRDEALGRIARTGSRAEVRRARRAGRSASPIHPVGTVDVCLAVVRA